MNSGPKSTTLTRQRYGIGEWYGRSYCAMTPRERQEQAQAELRGGFRAPCPWRSEPSTPFQCNKKGGVCSLRLYEQDTETREVTPASGPTGGFCVTCPERFYEDSTIFRWIGETLLRCPAPIVLDGVGFLRREGAERVDEASGRDSANIAHVLVEPSRQPISWCAVDIQPVRLSSASISQKSGLLCSTTREGIDFSPSLAAASFQMSSLRLLAAELLVKVTHIRRWGKKTAVVVDRAFFETMQLEEDVSDVSNCDIAWFVVSLELRKGTATAKHDFVRLTTLERTARVLAERGLSTQEGFERLLSAELTRRCGQSNTTGAGKGKSNRKGT